MKFASNLRFALLTLLLIWGLHYSEIFLHEWTHGTVAWLTGYKSSPFDIYYGKEWILLSDIDEAVNYDQILRDGKPHVMAAIAIFPELLEGILFFFGLRLLRRPSLQKNNGSFAFFYWFLLLILADFYTYIPVRTFSSSGDMFNFLCSMDLSPWVLFIPGTLFVGWGIYQMFFKQTPRAYEILHIRSKMGRFAFLFTGLLIFFGYYGGVGFTQPYHIAHLFSWASWAMIPLFLFLLSPTKK